MGLVTGTEVQPLSAPVVPVGPCMGGLVSWPERVVECAHNCPVGRLVIRYATSCETALLFFYLSEYSCIKHFYLWYDKEILIFFFTYTQYCFNFISICQSMQFICKVIIKLTPLRSLNWKTCVSV